MRVLEFGRGSAQARLAKAVEALPSHIRVGIWSLDSLRRRYRRPQRYSSSLLYGRDRWLRNNGVGDEIELILLRDHSLRWFERELELSFSRPLGVSGGLRKRELSNL